MSMEPPAQNPAPPAARRQIELTPDNVARAEFALVRRGYEPDEVRSLLVELARFMVAARSREVELVREVKAVRDEPSGPVLEDLDDLDLIALVGERTAKVLATARDAASEIQRRSLDKAQRVVQQANDDALRLRNDAERTLKAARDSASDTERKADQRAKTIVLQAETEVAKLKAEAEATLTAARAEAQEVSADANALATNLAADADDVSSKAKAKAEALITRAKEEALAERDAADAQARSAITAAEVASAAAHDEAERTLADARAEADRLTETARSTSTAAAEAGASWPKRRSARRRCSRSSPNGAGRPRPSSTS
jgi:DivIVA domain-containing protein